MMLHKHNLLKTQIANKKLLLTLQNNNHWPLEQLVKQKKCILRLKMNCDNNRIRDMFGRIC